MPDALSQISTRQTPQSEQADPRQVPNSAGGYTFTTEPVERLRRFLVLGTEGGTYYIKERDLTRENAGVVIDWAKHRTSELVEELVTMSVAGRAPRQNPILFALAAACSLGPVAGRKYALEAVNAIVRTGYQMFVFAGYVNQFRGWGRGLRRAVAEWYTTKPVDKLAYQALKYRQREGWTHRDLLRLSHPRTDEASRKALFDFICNRLGEVDGKAAPDLLHGYLSVQSMESSSRATNVDGWLKMIERWPSLSWEMFPDAALNEPQVWEALLAQGMPLTALIRQLPRLTRLNLFKSSSNRKLVTDQLSDADALRRARVHPINVLVALRTYASGQSARGDSIWTPHAQIVDALDAAFYASFGNVEPANKRTMLALDVSGSMGMAPIAKLPLTPREATAALALVTAATEPNYEINGFSNSFVPLAISPRQRLDDAIRAVSGLPFQRTDCAIPMKWALKNGVQIDTFVIYTDNETWYGSMHPHEALHRYRDKMGIDARLVVVGMTATDFTIADPADPGSLDVAGFDLNVPQLISNFSARAV